MNGMYIDDKSSFGIMVDQGTCIAGLLVLLLHRTVLDLLALA